MAGRSVRRLSVILTFAAVSIATLALTGSAWAADDFQALTKAWYQDTFRAHPLYAGYSGIHDWDDKFEDISLAGHAAERKRLHDWLAKFEAVDPARLSLSDRDDREVVISQIKASLLEEETIQAWRHNPDVHSSEVTEGTYLLVKRDYAPLPQRMRFAIAREKQIPTMLATAKTLIQDPPHVFVEIALENIDGSIDFFKSSLPKAFEGVEDAALKTEFAATNAQALAALEDYKAWLTKLLPTAKGSFALGAENFAAKLRDDEMIDTPLDQLLQIGYAQLKKDQQALAAAAHEVDPTKTTDEVVAAILKDHPTADALVSTARDELEALRQFIVDKKLTPLPPETMPTVAETPEFERAQVEAELDPPGPYETHANQAFYFVTPPDPSAKPAEQEAYLESFNIPILNNTSVHEAFPGHFVQIMVLRALPGLSMVRRLAQVNSYVEGWAHYCEQMTLDEGFGHGDPKLRIGQLLDALLRDARFVAGIEMHTRGMTVEQATELFVKEGHQTRPFAEKEAKRGTTDPTYLYYAVGKLEILKLRADWKAKMGDKYSIGDFHRRFLEGGSMPIKIIRREMMGADGALL